MQPAPQILPPIDAYRYWPQGDYVYYGANKNIVRLIFYKTKFTPIENQELMQFKASLPSLISPQYFQSLPEPELLRVLLGCKFNYKKAAQAIVASHEWRSKVLPDSYHSLWGKIQRVLNSGMIYVHGRDHRFRPILVVNLERMNLKRFTVEEYSDLLCFTLEYMRTHMLLPGQVENWVVIVDLCKIGLTAIPRSELKSIIKVLQDNFRCRMVVNYIVNAPTSINWLWKIAKNFMEDHTVKKIKINGSVPTAEMASHINPSQLEAKYGGYAPNAEVFWPPTVPLGGFALLNENPETYLSSISSYEEYFPPARVEPSVTSPVIEVLFDVPEEESPKVKQKRRGTVHTTKSAAVPDTAPESSELFRKSVFISKFLSSDDFDYAFHKNYGTSKQEPHQTEEMIEIRQASLTREEADHSPTVKECMVEEPSLYPSEPLSTTEERVLCCTRIVRRCSIF
mmetsp:Transcript_13917/g.26089  ORF Transcript_13917/g.26089 Transcript_13917/m.26089 type:complete len:453 (+) Transcript_13917:86-1444(+)